MKVALSFASVLGLLGIFSFTAHAVPTNYNDRIQKDYSEFREAFKDLGVLFSANDIRGPLHKKLLEQFKADDVDVQIKLKKAKKLVDEYQKNVRPGLFLNAVRVSDKQFPKIYALAERAAKALELSHNFNVFVVSSPEINAFTYSYNANDFDVVLYSGLVDNLSEEALGAVIGHEMGHVKDQAILYSVLFSAEFETTDHRPEERAEYYARSFDGFPDRFQQSISQMARKFAVLYGHGLKTADLDVREFSRQCETTADHAAVVVTGETATLKALATLAYGSKALTPEFSVDALIEQIKQVLADTQDPEDLKNVLAQRGSHPFDVLRLIETKEFAASKQFKDLVARQAQTVFGKELDTFALISLSTNSLKDSLIKYQADTAETDDPLVRISKIETVGNQIKLHSRALSALSELVVTQVKDSELFLAQNEVFDLLVTKVKADKDSQLRAYLLPKMIEMMKKALEEPSLGGDRREQVETRMHTLEGLLDAIGGAPTEKTKAKDLKSEGNVKPLPAPMAFLRAT